MIKKSVYLHIGIQLMSSFLKNIPPFLNKSSATGGLPDTIKS